MYKIKLHITSKSSPIRQLNIYILEILITGRHTLVTQNHRTSVRLHYYYISHDFWNKLRVISDSEREISRQWFNTFVLISVLIISINHVIQSKKSLRRNPSILQVFCFCHMDFDPDALKHESVK